MIDKQCKSAAEAVEGIKDGAVILVGGFGQTGEPMDLLDAIAARGLRDLTIVANGGGSGEHGIGRLLAAGCVRKLVCSFPRVPGSVAFEELYEQRAIELEIVPQGTIAERVRAGGAGIPAFYVPTGAGTELADGKELREFEGRTFVMEHAIKGDVAVIKADRADRWGNLTYRLSARNFNPVMAMGAELTIAQVEECVPLGGMDPETIITPSIFVDRVVEISGGVSNG